MKIDAMIKEVAKDGLSAPSDILKKIKMKIKKADGMMTEGQREALENMRKKGDISDKEYEGVTEYAQSCVTGSDTEKADMDAFSDDDDDAEDIEDDKEEATKGNDVLSMLEEAVQLMKTELSNK
jgi:hypothetical protein